MSASAQIKQLFTGSAASLQAAKVAADAAQLTVLNRIGTGRLRIPSEPQTLQLPRADEVAENLRRSRLRVAAQQKDQLEAKLARVQDSIALLSSEAAAPQKQSPHGSERDFAEWLKTYKKEKRTRAKLLQKETEKRLRNLEAADQLEALRQQEEEARKLTDKQERLHRLQEQAETRRTRLQHQQNSSRKGVNYKPLYMVKEQEYFERFMVPELERRKKQLSLVRELRAPLNYEELRMHEQQYLQRSQSLADRKASQIVSPPRSDREDTRLKPIQRMKEYAASIKKSYLPVVDPFKQKEMQLIKERIANPVPRRVFPSMSSQHTKSTLASAKRQKPMAPPAPLRRPSRDYLAELRKLRELSDQEVLNSLSVRSQPRTGNSQRSFDSTTSQAVLQRAARAKAWDAQILNAEEHLNEALLSDLHGKLAQLKR